MDQNTNNTGTSAPQQGGSVPQPSVSPADQAQSSQPQTQTEAGQTSANTAPPVQNPPMSSGQAAVGATPGATAGIPQPAPSSINPPPQSTGQAVPPVHKKGKPMLWVMILLIFAFLCGLLLAVWYFQTQLQKVSPAEQTTQVPVTTPSKIVIGTDATFQPMEYTASEGALMGYDIDLGNRIGEEWGTEVEFKNIPWDDLFQALENKQVDMIMSAVTVTDERKKNYDFSEAYLNAGQVVIVRKTDTMITSAADLQGKKIAVQEGTTNEAQAMKLTSESLVIRYPDFELATQALVNGQADAILSDLPGAKGIITENRTLKIASDPLTNEYYAVVFRKGDPNVAKVNEILSSLRTQGVLTDLKQKWLD